MKALSVRAPWWWAILHGKPVENRDWYTNFRGRICLHASKWWRQDEVCSDLDEIDRMAREDGFGVPDLPFFAREMGGCIVGTVEITDCVRCHSSAFFVGKYGFVLRDPVIIPKPIPLRGALGFFDVPDAIAELLNA